MDRDLRTLFVGLHVTDLERSLRFYTIVGYELVGRVDLDDGRRLAMLKFPGESSVALELVEGPGPDTPGEGGAIDHLAIRTTELSATVADLVGGGLHPGPTEHPGGADGPKVSWLTDPDGCRIELVEWPPGHSTGMTAADFGRTEDRPTPSGSSG